MYNHLVLAKTHVRIVCFFCVYIIVMYISSGLLVSENNTGFKDIILEITQAVTVLAEDLHFI